MDPITDVLHDLKLEQTYFCCSELRSPWGIRFPARRVSAFHAVISGSCLVKTEDAQVALGAGGFALLPHGAGHELLGAPGDPVTPADDLGSQPISEHACRLTLGGNGPTSVLVCGVVKCGSPVFEQLRPSLPSLLSLEPSAEQTWLAQLVTTTLAETHAARAGALTILQRLVEVLVIKALQRWIEHDDLATGWIQALRDPQIGQALSWLHRQPARAWTVAELATQVNMSRSVFSERFRRLVGVPPMKYLATCRFRAASQVLRSERRSVAEVAAQLGYESEASFARAFKRTLGVTPGSVRRSSATSEADTVDAA